MPKPSESIKELRKITKDWRTTFEYRTTPDMLVAILEFLDEQWEKDRIGDCPYVHSSKECGCGYKGKSAPQEHE